jgi:phosphoglycolate phosphatase-like HAD superfamily hydrolase
MTKSAADGGRFDLVVFDFDGTLCDSADVKTEAFHLLYLDEEGPDVASAVRDHHLANAGVSRYDKIRYVEREILGNDPDEDRVQQVAIRFSHVVEEAVVAAPLFDGVLEFVAAPRSGVRCAIASATPTVELRRIAERKGISRFFDAIEGSRRTKAAILSEYLVRFATDPDRAVMVGDQRSDADAARIAGVEALLIAAPAGWITPFQRVDDFRGAAEWLTTGRAG